MQTEMKGRVVLAELNRMDLISLAEYGWVMRKRPDLLILLAQHYSDNGRAVNVNRAFNEIKYEIENIKSETMSG